MPFYGNGEETPTCFRAATCNAQHSMLSRTHTTCELLFATISRSGYCRYIVGTHRVHLHCCLLVYLVSNTSGIWYCCILRIRIHCCSLPEVYFRLQTREYVTSAKQVYSCALYKWQYILKIPASFRHLIRLYSYKYLSLIHI